MCLEIAAKLSKHAKVQIGPRGLSSQFGLSITKTHNDLGECLHFSLDGACSCDLLKKRSDDDSRWVLEDAAADKLAAAVKRIGEDTKGFLFRAYWLGDAVPEPVRIKLAELVELIARNQVPRNVGRWTRRVFRSKGLNTFSAYVRMWALLTLGVYVVTIVFVGPGSGLLPSPWDEIVCGLGGIAIGAWQAWSMIRSDHLKNTQSTRVDRSEQ